VLGRDPRLRQPPVGEQLAQPLRVLAIGLSAPLAPPQRPRLHRLGQMRHRARRHQRIADEQPARARLHRNMHLTAAKAFRPARHGRRRRGDAATHHLTRLGVQRVESDLRSMHIQPGYDRIRAASTAPALPPRASLSRRAEGALSSCHLRAISGGGQTAEESNSAW
jgi:hypothetical protein